MFKNVMSLGLLLVLLGCSEPVEDVFGEEDPVANTNPTHDNVVSTAIAPVDVIVRVDENEELGSTVIAYVVFYDMPTVRYCPRCFSVRIASEGGTIPKYAVVQPTTLNNMTVGACDKCARPILTDRQWGRH